MLRLKGLAFFIIFICAYFPISAQTSDCSAKFSYQLDGKKVIFTGTDTAGVTSRWIFGDGSAAVVTHNGVIYHEYANAGQYEVKHFIERPGTNCRDSSVQLVLIPSGDSCNLQLKYAVRKDSLDCRKVYFINYSLPAPSNTHFIWKFGDGSTSNDASPSHTYAAAGKYYVCLVAEAGTNCRKEICDSITIACGTDCNISARFEWKKDSSNCKNIYFINHAVPISPNIHFAWSFGDGTVSHDINPVHTYKEPGKYYVCLVTEAGTNCRKEFCDSVTVKCETDCNISAKFEWRKDSSHCKNIYFINRSAPLSANVHFEWNFGDGTSSHDINSLHTYKEPGRYYVCLVTEEGEHCRKEFCDSITISCVTEHPPCDSVHLKFEFSANSNISNLIHFKMISNASPASAIWRISRVLGDNQLYLPVATLQGSNPEYRFRDTGWYKICLNVYNNTACHKEYCGLVHITNIVREHREISIAPNPATDHIVLELYLESQEQVTIRIMNAVGILKAEYHKAGVAGVNRFTLAIDNLRPGIYMVQVRAGSKTWVRLFQKI